LVTRRNLPILKSPRSTVARERFETAFKDTSCQRETSSQIVPKREMFFLSATGNGKDTRD
jgi:hypothetical protein